VSHARSARRAILSCYLCCILDFALMQLGKTRIDVQLEDLRGPVRTFQNLTS
jgi:hypothetical protein